MRVAVMLVLGSAAALAIGSASERLTAPAQAEDDATAWPFGVPAGGTGHRRDLYNLGILGVKVRDPERTEVADPGSGVRKIDMTGFGETEDHGPAKLRVEMLYPGGPAAKARLRVGDVIVEVNGVRFGVGSLAAMATAILEAESGKSKGGAVAFTIERPGAKDLQTVTLTVPVVGADAATPTTGKMREQMLAAAAAWLATRQQADGGFPQTLDGMSGSVCATSIAGLAWLASGSDLKTGPHAKRIRAAATFVGRNAGVDSSTTMPPGVNGNCVNWGLTHATIFLAELQARSPDAEVAKALRTCAAALAATQEASGGWAHGPGGPNGLGYVELNIMTGLAFCGLGMAKRSGFEPPADVMKKAEDYLVGSLGKDGGIAYSTSSRKAGHGNIGRTAIAWLAAQSLGQRNAPYATSMEGYVRAHAGDIFEGHASLMQQALFGGVAAHSLGADARATYWATCERDLVLARSLDGSFQPRPWHESVAMQTNPDVGFGDIWTTGAWAIVLGCEPVKGGRPGLPAWMGKLPPPLPPAPPKSK